MSDDKTDQQSVADAVAPAQDDAESELRFKRDRVRVIIEMEARLVNGQLLLGPTAPSLCRGCMTENTVTRCRDAAVACYVAQETPGPFVARPMPQELPQRPEVPGRTGRLEDSEE